MPKFVRVRPDVASVLKHPESGALIVPDPGKPLPDNDKLVKAYPWAFVSDEDLAKEQEESAQAVRLSAIEAARAADVESATREPGEKRTARKKS